MSFWNHDPKSEISCLPSDGIQKARGKQEGEKDVVNDLRDGSVARRRKDVKVCLHFAISPLTHTHSYETASRR